MRITPKSGRPVFGHIEVNSGQSIAISNSRSGRGFGKVSSVDVDIDDQSTLTALGAGVSIRPSQRCFGPPPAGIFGGHDGRRPEDGQVGTLFALRGAL